MTGNKHDKTALAIVIAGLCFCVGTINYVIAYDLGEKRGRQLEREETRVYVNDRMREADFCRWLQESRIVADCLTKGRQ